MGKLVRIPITNIYAGGDYTGRILVGPTKKALNVLLDTGSSALALAAKKYKPRVTGGDKTTDLAQTDAYGDGSSWTGAVITTQIAAGTGSSAVVLKDGNAAIAYDASSDMWGLTDGILGLAYAPLDDAFTMPADTWKKKYTATRVRAGQHGVITPYLTQLFKEKITADKISFLTHRSFIHEGGGGAKDPLNNGWMIIGGGDEDTSLYTGGFQTVKVLSDQWYCTNLKEVIVGNNPPIASKIKPPVGMPSNSIVDSGTNSLDLSPPLLDAILSQFSAAQQTLLNTAIKKGRLVSMKNLDLSTWPSLKFVLEGDVGDVTLEVPPTDYWQVNTQQVGFAAAAITVGEPGLCILGLPLMNPYFTVYDGEADNGRGVIKFAAKAVNPAIAKAAVKQKSKKDAKRRAAK